MSTLRERFQDWLPAARRAAAGIDMEPVVDQIGIVDSVGAGIATVAGLPHARLNELLLFSGGLVGMAVALHPDSIGCVLLGSESSLAAGSVVRGTGTVARVPVGNALLGRVVDPLARPIDGGAEIAADDHLPIERPPPGLTDRALVTRPLETGITVVDAMLPIGRGQRELVIGDRSTGKTTLAVDAIVNQSSSDVICVYVAVGQRASIVDDVVATVRDIGPIDRTLFVVASADAAPGLQWLAPYAAFSMAEHFRDRGLDTLVVIDDMTKHAAVYRQLSLLLRAPPGREAYPGDIFYIHARLLERAAQLSQELGGGSLTALPIAETQGGSLTGYIPTNLVSITDGQIVLDAELFHQGQKPAVDVGLSVSRVGSKTQLPAMKQLGARLRLEYAQYLELELFTRFGGMLDSDARRAITRGHRIRAALRQPQHAPLGFAHQIALLSAVDAGLFDAITEAEVMGLRAQLPAWLERRAGGVLARARSGSPLRDNDRSELLATVAALIARRTKDE